MKATRRRGFAFSPAARRQAEPEVADILDRLDAAPRVPGTSVYLTAHAGSVPGSLTTMLDRYRILSECVIVMSVRIAGTPYGRTTEIHGLTDGITAVDVEFGYREPLPVFDALLSAADRPGSAFTVSQVAEATFVLSTEAAVPSRESALPYWQQRLYIALRRRQQPWSAHAQLPPSQTLIIGREVSL